MQDHNRGETISPEYSDKTNSGSGWSAVDTLKVSDTPEKSGDDSPEVFILHRKIITRHHLL